jgi:hypothetical protein
VTACSGEKHECEHDHEGTLSRPTLSSRTKTGPRVVWNARIGQCTNPPQKVQKRFSYASFGTHDVGSFRIAVESNNRSGSRKTLFGSNGWERNCTTLPARATRTKTTGNRPFLLRPFLQRFQLTRIAEAEFGCNQTWRKHANRWKL